MMDQGSTQLELRTLLFVRELADGRVVCWPLADASLASYGEQESALAEQRTFLEEHLAQQAPEVLSRFSFPAPTQLHEVEVELTREDLPEKLQLRAPVTVACVVIPQGRDRWVVVPAIDHTFHLDADEELAPAVRDEVRRLVEAQQASPLELCALFPARTHRLEPLSLQVDRSLQLVPGRARALRKMLADRRERADAVKVLDSVGVALHQRGDVLRGPPLIGRERELEQLGALLDGKERLSVLLSGEPGAGKTALLHAWIRGRQGRRTEPVYALSGSRLLAGMSGLGQWQERAQRVLRAAESLDAVLAFDSLAELFSDRPGGQVDLAGAIRPFLDEGRVRLVGELAAEELDHYEGLHAGFMAALQRLRLQPLSAQQAVAVVRGHVEHAARHAPQRPNLDPEAVQPLVDLVDRYLPASAYPGKAIRLLHEARALVESTAHDGKPPPLLGEKQVYEAFSLQTGVPELLLRDDVPLELEQIIAALRRRMIGQEAAVRRVAETVCLVKARLQPPAKPLASFLFIGPTGVGKTELARSLAQFIFGAESRLTRFDMSEFADAPAAERLIRGTDRREGLLTRRVRQQPFCVLLLDEIEKAHPAVFDLLLQGCGVGRPTDAAGRLAHFHNAILIMTSNLGAAGRRPPIGIGARGDVDDDYYLEQVNRSFRPELVNRIDRVVTFHPLGEAETLQIARLALARLPSRRGLSELHLTVSVSEGGLRRLASEGTSAQLGARALRRHLEQEVVAPLAALLCRLAGRAQGAHLELGAVEEEFALRRGASGGREQGELPAAGELLGEEVRGGLRLRLLRGRGKLRARGSRGIAEMAELRRDCDRQMQLTAVTEVKEQIDFAVAQLAGTRGTRRGASPDPRRAREITELQSEHHRLQQIWERGEAARTEVASVEELGLAAVLDEEDPSPLLEEARAAGERFRTALFYLLCAMRRQRDGAVVLLQELEGDAHDAWLLPLLERLGERRWTLTAHLDGDPRGPGDDWPAQRRWGPPRTAAQLAARLAGDSKRPGALLLRIAGPWAGVVFPLEAGLHSYPGGQKGRLLLVRFLAAGSQLTELDWLDEKLLPITPARFAEVRREAPVRRFQSPAGPCLLLGGERQAEVSQGEYWSRYELIGCEHLLAYADHPERSLDDLFVPEVGKTGKTEGRR